MSQIIKNSLSGPVPPQVPTSFVTDNGTSIPIANIENINGGYTSTSNDNGISTSGTTNVIDILLTNRLFGTVTTTDNTTHTLVSFTLGATPLVYRFEFQVAGRSLTNGNGVGYTFFASARTDGTTATIIDQTFDDADADVSLMAATAFIATSGDQVLLLVQGVLGQTISYKAVGSYLVI